MTPAMIKVYADAFINLVKSVGFPIVVASILLLRYDKRLSEMNNILQKICRRMDALVILAQGGDVREEDFND